MILVYREMYAADSFLIQAIRSTDGQSQRGIIMQRNITKAVVADSL